jgi:DNA-binding NarL/FixJ family response regulator
VSDVHVAVLCTHRLLAESLATALSAEPGIASARVLPGPVAATQAKSRGVDVLVVEEGEMRGLDGLGLPMVAVLDRPDAETAVRLLYEGASGLCLRTAPLQELIETIQLVMRGETHLPTALIGPVLTRMAVRQAAPRERPASHLTAREVQILRLLGGGASRGEIARLLTLSPHTVRTHIQNALGKLSLHSQMEAGAYARDVLGASDDTTFDEFMGGSAG